MKSQKAKTTTSPRVRRQTHEEMRLSRLTAAPKTDEEIDSMIELSWRSGLESIIFRNFDGHLKEEAIRNQREIDKLADLLELELSEQQG